MEADRDMRGRNEHETDVTMTAEEATELTTKERYLAKAPTLKEALQQPTVMQKITALTAWWFGTRVGRMISRYGMQRGAMMSGGIAYSALFSIGSALTIAWTILMGILGADQHLLDKVVRTVNQGMPGLLTTPEKQGLLNPEDLVMKPGFSLTSLVSIVVLVFSATFVMSNLRIAIRAMFGIALYPSNFLVEKLRDLLGFVVLTVGVLLTTALGFLVSQLGTLLLDAVGLNGPIAGYSIKVASLIVAALVDAGVFITLVAFVSGVRVPWTDLWKGAIMFGIASGVLRYLGTSAVGSVSKYPLLASFAALATLMLWINLLARVTQMLAAWTANPPTSAQPNDPQQLHINDRPNYVTYSDRETLLWPHQTITGTVDSDPELDPNAVVEEVHENKWGGLAGWIMDKRIAHTEAKLERLRANR